MPNAPPQPTGMLLDQALRLLLSDRGEAVVLVTEGDTSMVPHLLGGDAVLAAPFTAPPRRGDLLLYRQREYWVVHRCLGAAVTPDGRHGLRTRGDGRNVLDPLLSAEDVRARVVALRRGGAWRSLKGPLARAYAFLMAWHDLVWAAAGFVARGVGLGPVVVAIDLAILRLGVPLVFPLLHRRIPPPESAVPDGTV